jgi:hypothetical protein
MSFDYSSLKWGRIVIGVIVGFVIALAGKVVQIKPIGAKKQGDMTYTVVIRPDQHEDRLYWNMTATVTVE